MKNTAILLIFTIIFGLLRPGTSFSFMSVEDEQKLGNKLLRMVKEQANLVHDPEITAYVSGIGNKILDKVEGKYFDYRFFVIADEGINAFAMPGGLIFVHSGLIEAIDSENDLACVLAHEIGHVQGRHIARRMAQMQKINIATAAVAVAGLFLGGGQSGSAALVTAGALSASLSLKYSRSDEEEADRRACQWICASGYNPGGLITVMKKIQQSRWIGSDTIPSYLSTHPSSSTRITYLEDILTTSPCRGERSGDTFLFNRVKTKTAVSTGRPSTLVRYYSRMVKEHPDDLIARYGLALAHLRAREFDEAIRILRGLILEAPSPAPFKVDLGKTYIDAGRYDEAVQTLEAASKELSHDPALAFHLAQGYLELNTPQKALPLLRSIEETWPDDGEISLLLGRTHAALGDKGLSHYHFFVYYREIGDREAARYHRNMAKKLLPADSPLLPKLDQKDPEEEQEEDIPPPKNQERDQAPSISRRGHP